MNINLRHVGLIVKDIDTSLKLYRDILGFTPKVDQEERGDFFEHLTGIKEGSARTTKCYAEDNSCIELIQFITPVLQKRIKNLSSEGFNHIALNVKNLKDLEQKLRNLNIEFINAPRLNDEKSAMVAFCKDFEGNLSELVQTEF